MMKTFKATWLGDEDPFRQLIEFGGLRFVKGEAADVPADHPMAAKIMGNPRFSSEKNAEVIAAVEPERPDPEEGTEIAAAKKQAADLGIKLQGNPSLDTVRARIAEHLARHG